MKGDNDEDRGEENEKTETENAGRDLLPASPAGPPAATAGLTGGRAGDDPALIRPGADHETADQDRATILFARFNFATAASGQVPATPDPWPGEASGQNLQEADERPAAPDAPPHSKTATPTDEVTGAGRRPKSPAELLGLTDATRARHQRCLANAIYFEARGETVRGQMAVAQVVINRVFSGHYPGNICGVVYQSTRRYHRLRCQFSFTCDGIPDRITEPGAFERATQIAGDALDGHFWLTDIGKATHYHARWVHPRWVREMRRLKRIGVHTFYRPRKWGDGAGSPVWGDAEATANAAKPL
jgi:spore germination cell wall hydrolase CwlJ-like protein